MKLTKKRKDIESLVYNTLSIIDKTGANTEHYKKMFSSMSDEEFDKFMKKFIKDDEENFYMEFLPYKNEPVLNDIIEAAKYLNVPLDEYVYYKHDGNKNDPIRSKYKVPVGYLNIKRMQQILFKKNSFSLDIDKRNSKTNQLTNDSKVARITDAENFSLNNYEADYALKEMMSCRADDGIAKAEILRDIANQGYCRLIDLTDDVANKQTLNTVDVYFTGAGLVTDLVTPGLMFRRTQDDREKRSASKEKFEESSNLNLSEEEVQVALKELFYRALQVGSEHILGKKDNLNEVTVSGVAQVSINSSDHRISNPYIDTYKDSEYFNNEFDIFNIIDDEVE